MAETDAPFYGPAIERVDLLLIKAAACLRAVQLVVRIPVPFIGGLQTYRYPGLVIAGYLLTVAWTVVFFGRALRARRMDPTWVYADVAVAMLGLLLIPAACVNSCATGWQHWVLPPAMGAAIVVAGFTRAWVAATGVALLVVAYLVGSVRQLAAGPEALGPVLVTVLSMVAFAVLAAVVAGHLRADGRHLDAATEAALAAGAREAAAQARFDERTRQYDVLHRTVLTTLSTIARGRLDHRAAEVRALAQRDADYLRGLITAANGGPVTSLASALAGVVRDKQALGLQVHSQFHELADLPADVEESLTNAAREALTNVAKHAGTGEAWLTAVGDDGGVVLTVVDRGRGFDPDAVPPGRGMLRELRHCVIEVGGRVSIDSAPDQGTMVEVSWCR
ncbi:ATP-binding protein [Micromonospora sp. NPDC049044]|uniref:sensor histidine kinase n=1 Tax=unclassified Micromonospora TaxID=2617518 RepID=UPI0033D7A073